MKSYSQWGEDVEVLEYFGEHDGCFLEVGANHPTLLSQTYLLEQAGWRGVLIEPNPKLAGMLIAQRKGSKVYQCAVSGPGSPKELVLNWDDEMATDGHLSTYTSAQNGVVIEVKTLDEVLEGAGVDVVDFMAIDIEGLEVAALRGFTFDRWRPRLILIEDHWDSYEKHLFLKRNGYKLVKRSVINSWYIPREVHKVPPAGVAYWDFIYGWLIGCAYRGIRKWLRGLI